IAAFVKGSQTVPVWYMVYGRTDRDGLATIAVKAMRFTFSTSHELPLQRANVAIVIAKVFKKLKCYDIFNMGAFLIFCNFCHVLMKRCRSVNPVRVVSSCHPPHERLQKIGNAPCSSRD